MKERPRYWGVVSYIADQASSQSAVHYSMKLLIYWLGSTTVQDYIQHLSSSFSSRCFIYSHCPPSWKLDGGSLNYKICPCNHVLVEHIVLNSRQSRFVFISAPSASILCASDLTCTMTTEKRRGLNFLLLHFTPSLHARCFFYIPPGFRVWFWALFGLSKAHSEDDDSYANNSYRSQLMNAAFDIQTCVEN